MIIEFKGALTGNTHAFWLRVMKRNVFMSISPLLILLVASLVYLSIKQTPLFLIGIIPYIGLIIALHFSPEKNMQKRSFPIYVVVDLQDGIISADSEQKSSVYSLDSIDTVLDYGESYFIKTPFFSEVSYICQKDLITQGSIEDFEQIFAGKIIRKTK